MSTGEDFRRSSRFGIVGVIAVAVAVAVIGLVFGSGSGNPTGALAAILVIVFAFVFALLALQRRDLDVAVSRSRVAVVASPAGPVADPTTADERTLLDDLAIGPIDRAALASAGANTWAIARASINSGTVLMVLIFLAMVPWILFQFAWSLVVFVPIIFAYAVFLAARALMPGGQLDRAYEDSEATLKPLGLVLTERPRVEVSPRLAGEGMRSEIAGPLVYEGARHGRDVTIRIDGGARTELSGATRPFTVRVTGERLRAVDGGPAEVADVLEPLRASSYWKGVSAEGGPNGVVVERRRDGGRHWLRDLWLAEHLADAARSS